jgi:hypothetical protein
MNIKLAKIDDIVEIREIISLRIKWFKDKNINQWQHDYLEWVNEDYLNDLIKKQQLYVIVGDREIIGTFALLEEDLEYWKNGNDGEALYIHHFTTRENYKKIGEYALKYIEKIALEKGKSFLRLDCSFFNEKLNKYYENFGFKYVGKFVESENYVAALKEKIL